MLVVEGQPEIVSYKEVEDFSYYENVLFIVC